MPDDTTSDLMPVPAAMDVRHILMLGDLVGPHFAIRLPLRFTMTAAAAHRLALAACAIKVRADERADNPVSHAEATWHHWPVRRGPLTMEALAAFALALSKRFDDRV